LNGKRSALQIVSALPPIADTRKGIVAGILSAGGSCSTTFIGTYVKSAISSVDTSAQQYLRFAGVWPDTPGEAQILALDVVGVNVSFGMFVAGLLLRGKPEFHKRLMLFGTIGMVGPAIARWPFALIASKPPVVGLVLQSFGLVTILFDVLTKRRVHRAPWVGVATLFMVPLIAIPMSGTPFWHHLLASLKQLLAGF
jgi:hypothetical protein